jgi:hypothetical protein
MASGGTNEEVFGFEVDRPESLLLSKISLTDRGANKHKRVENDN